MAKNHERFVADIQTGLQAAYERARKVRTLDLASARLIVFSDLHRGVRNRADDFRKCERAYNAALAYYLRLGYTLVALGDVEELWEERVRPVLRAYPRSQALEAKLHRAQRYLRVWGNHDDTWDTPSAVDRLLAPIYGGEPLKVYECLRFRVVDGAEELGELFLVHGHQGSAGSDRYSRLARIPVRFFWRTWQRMTGISLNTPATDWSLRHRHNLAMHEWAAAKERFVLVAGHTHRPVFESKLHVAQLEAELAKTEERLQKDPNNRSLEKEAAELGAEIEWVRAQDRRQPEGPTEPDGPAVSRPAYFNTGCCCYLDGDVTGIEISDGYLRLVRWPDDEDTPKPRELASTSLREVFAHCSAHRGAAGPATAEIPEAEPADAKEKRKAEPVLADGGT